MLRLMLGQAVFLLENKNLVLYSDSESSLKLLKDLDLARKSRHLEIRIEWLKSRIEDGQLVLEFKRGTVNPSDLLTKCLGSAAFGYHRSALGFEVLTSPIQSLMNISMRFVMVEVCRRPQSSISQVCAQLGIPYVGITADMEKKPVFSGLKTHLANLKCKYSWVHVCSPCSSGSPLRNFGRDTPSAADWEWFDLFPHVKKYMLLGTFSSFELPWLNAIWNYHLCKDTLKECGHNYATAVKLCTVGLRSKGGKSIGKLLGFTSSDERFIQSLRQYSKCEHETHADFNEVKWEDTGFYTAELAKVPVNAAKHALSFCP